MACEPRENPRPREDPPSARALYLYSHSLSSAKLYLEESEMKKLALGLATAGTFAAMTIGLASPAMAASACGVSPSHEAVYVTE